MAEKCWMYDGCKNRSGVCVSKGPTDEGCPVYRYFRDLIGQQEAAGGEPAKSPEAGRDRETVIAGSVKELKEQLAAGNAPEVGGIALRMNGMDWRRIDRTKEGGAVLMMAAAYDWRPFARPDKEHPWGWNNYEASQIRAELNGEILEDLFGEEKDLPEYWKPGMGRLFLLSMEEIGFKQTRETFAYFRGEDEDELDQRRQMKDRDGDPVSWFVRSPSPGYASVVRCVNTSGALDSSGAYRGYGAVAACIINPS